MSDEEKSGGVSPVVTVAVVLLAVVVVGYIIMPTHGPHTISRNESAAIAGLRTYIAAQNVFHRNDFYGTGKMVYANPKDGAGFPDLFQVGHGSAPRGEELELINVAMANANSGGTPKAGYLFTDISSGTEGPYDFAVECGLCAVPARHGKSGVNTFVIGVDGTVYCKDNGGTPVTTWPDVAAEGWQAWD